MGLRRSGLFLLVGSIAVAMLAAAACGGDDASTSSPPPLTTGTTSRPPPDAQAPRDALVLEASETAKAYSGSLVTTSTVPFGGGVYCNYAITIRDVAVELTILETGYVGTATVRNLVVEEAVECPYEPMPPSIQDFALKQSVTTASGTRIDFNASTQNRPETSLVVELVATAAGYDATLTWTRTDQTPPLAWTVTAEVPLTRK